MKVRGRRECRACGTEWSYYETGSVECPSCGSLHSRGFDERTEHTAGPASLDLTSARTTADEAGLTEGLSAASETCRSYRSATGFIHAGELEGLSSTYLAATELQYAAREATVHPTLDTDEQLYLFTLLDAADDGGRPDPAAVPESFEQARGLACAAAVDDYRSAIRTMLDDDSDPAVGRLLTRIDEHSRRIEALDGAVEPDTAELLVEAVQAVGDFVRGVAPTTEVATEALAALTSDPGG